VAIGMERKTKRGAVKRKSATKRGAAKGNRATKTKTVVESEGDTLKFSVDSSLLFQLGERLVAKPSIALAELVKNAYDADATNVTVTFEAIGKPGGTIVIEDDGHGMIFEEVQTSWMRIATTEKRLHPSSRIYKRPLTGAKGVGRFAARRLGAKLILQSIAERPDGSKESVIADFDWAKDFAEGTDLDKVKIKYTRQPTTPESKTGVSLFIEQARDAWTEDDLNELRRDLLSLQNPFPDLAVKAVVPKRAKKSEKAPEDPGFTFEMSVSESGGLDRLSGGLGEAFLKTAFARLDGEVDKKGTARYDIEVLNTGEKDELVDDSHDYKGLENARLRVYLMIYKEEYFKGSDFGLRAAQIKGRQEGGVRIYLDGFRVFPYGEAGDDWLQLDEYAAKNLDLATEINPPEKVIETRKELHGRPFLLVPKNNQVFGAVSLSQSLHENIEINVTRDRLIETEAVKRLRLFAQNGIYWAGLKYAAHSAERRAKRKKETVKSVAEIITDAKAAVEAVAEIPDEQRQTIVWNLNEAIARAEEEEQSHIGEISMLRILASAGTTITLMNHQLRALNGAVLRSEHDLMRLRSDVPKKLGARFHEIVSQISEWRETMELLTSQLGFLLAPDARQRRRHHVLYEVVEDVRKPMIFYMKKFGVKFYNRVPRTLRTPPIYRSELYSVLINLLSNALKAVHGQPEREVIVEAEKRGRKMYARMSDTGVGLPAERREISFKPFVTTSAPNPVLGVGTGLGLKVVRDILDLYDGAAQFVDPKTPYKTTVEIMIPDKGGAANDS
jgi:signal transduction histidine kinase